MINIINDFSFKFNSSVKFNFDSGDLTPDSGDILTEEFMHVTSSRLLQVIRYACKFIRIMVYRVFTVFILRKVPESAVNYFSCSLHRIAYRNTPACRAGCDNVRTVFQFNHLLLWTFPSIRVDFPVPFSPTKKVTEELNLMPSILRRYLITGSSER